MFEVGMSALVLKICSEYAKSLGLNFPPCTQQEINAICEWVDKHTIKDMTISQDGYNVTFTFKTENDTTKEFTFTIPKAIDIGELEKVLKGSDSIVVDRLADNSGLQVRLAQSVLNDIGSKLTKPTNPTAESAVTMLADGTVGTKPLSEIGGGKLYRHLVQIKYDSGHSSLFTIFYTSNSTSIDTMAKIAHISTFIECAYNGSNGKGSVLMEPYAFMGNMDVNGVTTKQGTSVNVNESGVTPTEIIDTVTEV